MCEDVQNGPFNLWQMFNAPTMVLFNNLENAADGLERLLTSILKLSGGYSEVLVPRSGTSQCPDEYYKSFNNWLIGRLFFVWSVDDLNRIHETSKDAQIKILSILSINGAPFYEDLHTQYEKILLELIDYYDENASLDKANTLVLQHFISKQINVPDVQLNLEPIFVNVTNIETCKGLIELTLQLLSKTIPLNVLQLDHYQSQYLALFPKVLHVMEYYDMDLKLFSIRFFAYLIKNYDNTAITKFSDTYPNISTDIINTVEAFTAMLHICYEKGEINELYLESVNNYLLPLFETVNFNRLNKSDHDALVSIATTVLQSNSKIFSKELKSLFLSLSVNIELPKEIISLKHMTSTDINILTGYYTKAIVECLEDTQNMDIQEDYYYKQVMYLISCLNFCEEPHIDDYLLYYYIERCYVALSILQRVYMERYELKCDRSTNIITKDKAMSILKIVGNILKPNTTKLMKNIEALKNIMEIILYIVTLHNNVSQYENMAFELIFLRNNLEYQDAVKCMSLKYFLLVNTICTFSTRDIWNKRACTVLNSFLTNKSITLFKQILPLSPLLLINNVLLPSRLIGDILMPAFLMSDLELQKLFQESLPVVTCISLGSYIVVLSTVNKALDAHTIFNNDHLIIQIVCSKCHNKDFNKSPEEFLNGIKREKFTLHIDCTNANNINTVTSQRRLLAKFLKPNFYFDDENDFLNVIKSFSNHTVFTNALVTEIFTVKNCEKLLKVLRTFLDNIENDENIEITEKESMFYTCINLLLHATKTSLERNDFNTQSNTLDCIKDFGMSHHIKVLLPTTKLLVYFITHPQCTLASKAVVYLRDICKSHNFSPNQAYHRYKKDYCKLFVDCCLYNGKNFARYLLKVVKAFGFLGYRDFISKDVHHFLPYLLPYSVKIPEVPSIIEEIASFVQCSVADFLIERFPHVYTHLYLFESEPVIKKCYGIIETMTKTSILNLIKKHFRVVLTEFLLQYCSDPEKVLNACRYLASHDPDESVPSGSMNMTTSQIADFLQPKFFGVLAYFDHKLVNTKVALSVKRKALQSFPHIMKLIGVKYLTMLRFKVLATLRSALSLAKEFPKILAAAWSTFISNIDSMNLGPMLPNLAVSLIHQLEFAPNEINKIFQYLVLRNENLLSAHISDLFFLSDSNISEKVKLIIKRHVTRAMPEGFLDKVKWYLQHLSKDIPNIKAYVFTCLDKLVRKNRTEVHKAIFGGKNIDPVIVEFIESLLLGCQDPEHDVRIASGACLGELGAIEAGQLPRQYVHSEPAQFAFSISDDCFASNALVELTRACQYEKDTMNVHCYALSIQEILKVYDISPTGSKKDIWFRFPENMHQIMDPLLRSRYTLAYPSQPKKTHPLFGTVNASTYLEWSHNWTAQLIPLIEKESIRELLRTVHPSMRRDVRTLFLFIPYVVLHAVMSKSNAQYIQEEMLAVIGLENFHNENKSQGDRNNHKLLRHIRLTPNISTTDVEECNQSKCCKMIYTLLDFLNHWLLEWAHTKQLPLLNDNYKAISVFLEKFDKLTIAKGNFICGEFERALQYLELYMEESKDQMQNQLPFLAEIYAVLDEPDSIAGILSMQRTEPSLKQLILTQIVTGRLQDAAVCYERLAQEGQLDTHSLQGMVECYLGLDQPFTAYRLLNELDTDTDGLCELAAEPLWRLGRFEQLEQLVKKPVPPSRENWGLLMGRILLSFRDQNRVAFQTSCTDGMTRLLSQVEGEGKSESCLRNNYQTVFGLHIIKEAGHVEHMLHKLKELTDGSPEGFRLMDQLIEEWRRRAAIVQADVRSMEALLRCRRTLLLQTQEILQPTHPQIVNKLKSCIGDLWLQSAKQARKAEIFQQAYMYILNAEEYAPEELFIEKAKMYWARKQPEHAFTTLKRGLEETYPEIHILTQEQRKICAKAKLLIAKYNDESTSVDVDVNTKYYKDAVDVYKQWEKSLVSLGSYYEKVSSSEDASSSVTRSLRVHALNCYGKSLQYGHKYLYQSMPRMLSIWLDIETNNADKHVHMSLSQMTGIIKTYSEHLPLYLYLTAFSQIVSRICHPVREVYLQLKAIIVKLILAYPQHTLWMMMSVIKSGYPQRIKRCQDVFNDLRLKEPHILKLYGDFTQLAEKLIELCNKPNVGNASTITVSSLVRALPRLLAGDNFSHIMMPFQEYCKIVLPSKAARQEKLDFYIPSEPPVYIAGIEERITILPSLQKPRKVALKGSDGKSYFIMLKPRDDLRKDFRLMEFNGVVNRFLHDASATRRRRLYLRTYAVLPLNEECGVIEWVPNLVGLRPILMHIYKQKGIHTSNRELKEMMCSKKDSLEKQRHIFLEQLIPRHPPVFQLWFRRIFSDPYAWYQARSAYIRTTAVISMVGYILGLGDRHGENISFDSTNGDTVHVDFNCLFNKGESFDWPERVPFRLTHNMEAAMGPLTHEGMFRKSCEAVMHALREQVDALMSVIGPFVYDPLVTWGSVQDSGERTNEQALQHLHHIRQRLNGMVRTKNKQVSVSLSPEGQVEQLIAESTSIDNLCQMYIGWGPFL